MLDHLTRETKLPKTYAARRESVGATLHDSSNDPELQHAWRRSQQHLADIMTLLEQANLDQQIVTVAASGSLGRMEAVRGSDADLIVIVRDGIDPTSPTARALVEEVWTALEPLDLALPKAVGIYGEPTTAERLCRPEARGQVDEDIPTFGKRFQLLWDAQPVHGFDGYERLLTKIIDWYTAVPDYAPQTPWWRYPLDDLLRYHRALCVATHSEKNQLDQMRRFKMAHSRPVMYAALLGLLGACSHESPETGRRHFQACLKLTPLERLFYGYPDTAPECWNKIAACYTRFLIWLGDEDFRETLREGRSTEELEENGAELSRVLAALISHKQTTWPEDFTTALWL